MAKAERLPTKMEMPSEDQIIFNSIGIHVARMGDERGVRRIFEVKPEGNQ